MTFHEKRWSAEEHFFDLEAKIQAMRKMKEHHLEEAEKSRSRERYLLELYHSMVRDIADSLWWEIGEVRAILDERSSIFYLKDQKQRNLAWSEWVELTLQMNRLDKLKRDIEKRLEAL